MNSSNFPVNEIAAKLKLLSPAERSIVESLIEYMKTLNSESASAGGDKPPTQALEQIPPDEESQINDVIALTIQQLKNRYPGQQRVLRAVHAKDHGCVKAVFQVLPDLDAKYRVGVFAEPGPRKNHLQRLAGCSD